MIDSASRRSGCGQSLCHGPVQRRRDDERMHDRGRGGRGRGGESNGLLSLDNRDWLEHGLQGRRQRDLKGNFHQGRRARSGSISVGLPSPAGQLGGSSRVYANPGRECRILAHVRSLENGLSNLLLASAVCSIEILRLVSEINVATYRQPHQNFTVFRVFLDPLIVRELE